MDSKLLNPPCYTCVFFKKDDLDERLDSITGFVSIGECKMLHKRCRIKPNNVSGCAYHKNEKSKT